MNRRSYIRLMAFLASTLAFRVNADIGKARSAPSGQPKRDTTDWELWKAAFLTHDGRVVDHLQDDASHSEGQGYGMFLAAWFGDMQAFQRMDGWTSSFLAVRQDPLLAWRWTPNQSPQISDYNNATDGDLFHAWALLRAGLRFKSDDYLARAREVARFIAASCVRPDPRGNGRLLFLPGAERFSTDEYATVNPSYYMPLAMRELGLAASEPALLRCADDGEALLAELAVAVGLVPDWIDVGPFGWRYAQGHPAQSGYDALRSALFLIWSGSLDHPAVERAAAFYIAEAKRGAPVPTVIASSGKTVRATSDYPGYEAVSALVSCAAGADEHVMISRSLDDQPYFPATLHLFSQIASDTVGLTC
ncbi:glycosyl hydrolase family 8 [Cypionkella psychrotolerans]|uniref:glycosyl hydrolase family 8 n=1 Tax=Cypionkella psychrotolerans TaxID=1678131 RepID=UPI0006B610FF|nr:glycosyl hydrolase family 8 [Cypionkella psychrotolerans]